MRVNDGPERKMKENKSSPTGMNNVDGLDIAVAIFTNSMS